jgi:hypothetical protein
MNHIRAAVVWCVTAYLVGYVVFGVVGGSFFEQFVEPQTQLLIGGFSLTAGILGVALLSGVISFFDIAGRIATVFAGAALGFVLCIVIAVAIVMLFLGNSATDGDGIALLLLAPGSMLGGVLAGFFMARSFPPPVEYWPAPPQP